MGILCSQLCKMTEPIEMQFGMLSRVSRKHVLYRNVDAPTGRDTFEMSTWPIEKHCKVQDDFGGWVKE